MKKVKLKKFGLRALNDYYIIEEDAMDIYNDMESGINKDVASALKSGKLIIPDAYQDYAMKFPCRGTIISKGDKTKYEELQIGTRVDYARLGVQRYKFKDKSYCNCKETDIHAILD